MLTLVGPRIRKNDTNFRKGIPPAKRLDIALRFLASGESQQLLTFLGRCIGRSTISRIIRETCDAIYASFSDSYLHPPCSANDWINISKKFLDAIDGKHVAIECPSKSGALFCNYKSSYSNVLPATYDATYNFILFDTYGSNNDSGVLSKSIMGKLLESKSLNIPEPETLEGCEYEPLPYFLLGDEVFSLKEYMMRPFSGQLDED